MPNVSPGRGLKESHPVQLTKAKACQKSYEFNIYKDTKIYLIYIKIQYKNAKIRRDFHRKSKITSAPQD